MIQERYPGCVGPYGDHECGAEGSTREAKAVQCRVAQAREPLRQGAPPWPRADLVSTDAGAFASASRAIGLGRACDPRIGG